MKALIAHDKLLSLLSYDPIKGAFSWRRSGKAAGTPRKSNGYIQIAVSNRIYLAHRLAWFYAYGKWPESQIDHINGDPRDNRLQNLREASPAQNMQNIRTVRRDSTSGHTGVSWHARDRRWVASITVAGKKVSLGRFTDKTLAISAYESAKPNVHPFSAVASSTGGSQ